MTAFTSHGVPVRQGRDHLHVFDGGFAYASPWLATRATARPTAVILLSADGAPFTVTVGGRRLRTNALALGPNTRRDLDARGVGLVSLNLMPSAALFPAFRALPAPGVLPLERSALAGFDPFLEALHTGGALGAAASERFDALAAAAVRQFPRPPPLDPRLSPILETLQHDADAPLPLQALAGRLGLSYHRTSHLFSAALGIPLKSYLAWQKQLRIYPLLLRDDVSLTEVAHAAGLPDSAYLSRLYRRWYGQRPSFMRDSNSVQVFHHDAGYDRLS